MPGAHFILQNFIGSRLKLSVVCDISLTDLLHRNKDYCLQ